MIAMNILVLSLAMPPLPRGWAVVDAPKDQAWRLKSEVHYLSARVDFDEDGILDYAVVVNNTSIKKSGIAFWLSKRPRKWRLMVDEIDQSKYMLLEAEKPTCFSYIGNGDRRKLKCAHNEFVSYFAFGSSGYNVIYNSKKHVFERYWISD